MKLNNAQMLVGCLLLLSVVCQDVSATQSSIGYSSQLTANSNSETQGSPVSSASPTTSDAAADNSFDGQVANATTDVQQPKLDIVPTVISSNILQVQDNINGSSDASSNDWTQGTTETDTLLGDASNSSSQMDSSSYDALSSAADNLTANQYQGTSSQAQTKGSQIDNSVSTDSGLTVSGDYTPSANGTSDDSDKSSPVRDTNVPSNDGSSNSTNMTSQPPNIPDPTKTTTDNTLNATDSNIGDPISIISPSSSLDSVNNSTANGTSNELIQPATESADTSSTQPSTPTDTPTLTTQTANKSQSIPINSTSSPTAFDNSQISTDVVPNTTATNPNTSPNNINPTPASDSVSPTVAVTPTIVQDTNISVSPQQLNQTQSPVTSDNPTLVYATPITQLTTVNVPQLLPTLVDTQALPLLPINPVPLTPSPPIYQTIPVQPAITATSITQIPIQSTNLYTPQPNSNTQQSSPPTVSGGSTPSLSVQSQAPSSPVSYDPLNTAPSVIPLQPSVLPANPIWVESLALTSTQLPSYSSLYPLSQTSSISLSPTSTWLSAPPSQPPVDKTQHTNDIVLPPIAPTPVDAAKTELVVIHFDQEDVYNGDEINLSSDSTFQPAFYSPQLHELWPFRLFISNRPRLNLAPFTVNAPTRIQTPNLRTYILNQIEKSLH